LPIIKYYVPRIPNAGVQKDGKKKLRVKLDHFETLQGRVLDLYREGYTMKEIIRILYFRKDLWIIILRGNWFFSNLINMAIFYNEMSGG